jgi:CRP/FNR family cyclic AMP-dependent transcriptional regulator
VALSNDARPHGRPEDTDFSVRSSFERTFDAAECVFEPGQPGDALFVVQSGQVELRRPGVDGLDRVVARYGPGEFFGEMGILLGRPRGQRAVAVTDARVLQLDGPTFEAMCVERTEIAIRVIQRLATRMIELEQRLAALGVDDLLRPVVRVLIKLAARESPGDPIDTNLRSLAAEAGLPMIAAHEGLNQLLDQKLVQLEDDELRIPDLDALAASLDPAE